MLAVGAVVLGFVLWIDMSDEHLLKNGIDVTGTMSNTGGRSLTVTYSYNGKIYKVVGSTPNSTVDDGEVYNIKIDPNAPEDFYIQFWKPVIVPGDYQKDTCTLIKKSPINNHKVEFHYVVAGEEYTRTQTIPPGLSDKSFARPSLFYKKAQPEIAYLFFDQAR